MKLYKMDLKSISNNIYGIDGIRFAMCKIPSKRKHVGKLHAFRNCREDLCGDFRKLICKKECPIDIKKTRLLLYTRVTAPNVGKYYVLPKTKGEKDAFFEKCSKMCEDRQRLFSIGQNLVNLIEKYYGWPRSRFYKIDAKTDPQLVAYMAVGTNRWQKTPHYLSLYVLLLRAGFNGFKTENWKYDAVKKALTTHSKTYNDHLATIVREGFDKWDILFTKQNALLRKKSIKEMYDRKRLAHGNNGYNDGIWYLLSGRSYDLRLSYRLRDLCEKEKIDFPIRRTRDEKILKGML